MVHIRFRKHRYTFNPIAMRCNTFYWHFMFSLCKTDRIMHNTLNTSLHHALLFVHKEHSHTLSNGGCAHEIEEEKLFQLRLGEQHFAVVIYSYVCVGNVQRPQRRCNIQHGLAKENIKANKQRARSRTCTHVVTLTQRHIRTHIYIYIRAPMCMDKCISAIYFNSTVFLNFYTFNCVEFDEFYNLNVSLIIILIVFVWISAFLCVPLSNSTRIVCWICPFEFQYWHVWSVWR